MKLLTKTSYDVLILAIKQKAGTRGLADIQHAERLLSQFIA